MYNAVDGRYGKSEEVSVRERGSRKVVVERAEGMVVRHEPQLSARVLRSHVRTDIPQDILMPQQHSANKEKIIKKYDNPYLFLN